MADSWIESLTPENKRLVLETLAEKLKHKSPFFSEEEIREIHFKRWKEELYQRSLPVRERPPSDGLGLRELKTKESDVLSVWDHPNDLGINNVVSELQKRRSK